MHSYCLVGLILSIITCIKQVHEIIYHFGTTDTIKSPVISAKMTVEIEDMFKLIVLYRSRDNLIESQLTCPRTNGHVSHLGTWSRFVPSDMSYRNPMTNTCLNFHHFTSVDRSYWMQLAPIHDSPDGLVHVEASINDLVASEWGQTHIDDADTIHYNTQTM